MSSVPVELSVLPVHVKQALIARGHYMLSPMDVHVLIDVCDKVDIPSSEALAFIEDQSIPTSDILSLKVGDIQFHSSHGIADIYGPPISGKSYLCRQAASKAAHENPHKDVWYIDCERSFVHGMLDNAICVQVRKPSTWQELLACIHEITCTASCPSLVIVDSITFIFRYLLTDSSEDRALRRRILKQILKMIERLNRETGCIVIVTHQTATSSDTSFLGKQYQEILSSCLHKSLQL